MVIVIWKKMDIGFFELEQELELRYLGYFG